MVSWMVMLIMYVYVTVTSNKIVASCNSFYLDIHKALRGLCCIINFLNGIVETRTADKVTILICRSLNI